MALGISVTEAIVAGKDVLMNMINELLEEIRPTMSLEDIQIVYTKTVDKLIFHEEDTSKSKYIGGEFNLDYVSDKAYTCGYKLFFQDEKKKIYTLEAKSKEISMLKLSTSVREQIRTDKNIKFEIQKPDDKARALYNREKLENVK